MDGFPERLLAARKAAGLTQNALARAAKIPSEASISKYERGELEPRTVTLKRLADALGVSLDRLVGGDERPSRRRKAA